jgi:diguanylate cyclase (GGDEF)-like protein/PAS domain S-box-containing protein
MAIVRNITDRKKAEADLRLQASAINAASDQIVIIDAKGVVEFANPAFERETGYSAKDLIGKKFDLPEVVEQDGARQDVWRIIRDGHTWHGEIVSRAKNGSLRTEDITITPVKGHDGVVEHFIAIKRDVTEKKSYEKQLDRLAHHDHLTGLPNRLLFADRLNQCLAISRRNNQNLAVMFLDLDRFKLINDTLGHTAGDAVLKSVAKHLKSYIRSGDMCFRYGGDEFVITLVNTSKEKAFDIAERIRQGMTNLSLKMENGGTLHVSLSIGVAEFRGDETAETLIQDADKALYISKNTGKNKTTVYDDRAA